MTTSNVKAKCIRVALCGFGEVANRAHLPAILQSNYKFVLVAIVEPNEQAAKERLKNFSSQLDTSKIRFYTTLRECFQDASTANLDAVCVCTPATVTLDLAKQALEAGKHVMVEKPPGDWRRLQGLKEFATAKEISLFTAYHTAVCVGLHHVKKWLETHGEQLQHVTVTWKESVQKWHPGQIWVSQKSDLNFCEGVLEMVFNPLSLLSALLGPMDYQSSTLVIPCNWETPISGTFELQTDKKVNINGSFAWDYEGEPQEIWDMSFSAKDSILSLCDGGCQIYVDNQRLTQEPTPAYQLKPEYEALYEKFYSLISKRTSNVDDSTPRLLQEIQENASCQEGPPYNLV